MVEVRILTALTPEQEQVLQRMLVEYLTSVSEVSDLPIIRAEEVNVEFVD